MNKMNSENWHSDDRRWNQFIFVKFDQKQSNTKVALNYVVG